MPAASTLALELGNSATQLRQPIPPSASAFAIGAIFGFAVTITFDVALA